MTKVKKTLTPQSKATCIRLLTISPKKPNSANRRVVKANVLSTVLSAKIPGEGHSLQQHSSILLKLGKPRDLIGIKRIAIRGKYDLLGVNKRKTSRSIYGVKRS
jgi:small subunit ribosomal protein S12